jgi:hypothetical protein
MAYYGGEDVNVAGSTVGGAAKGASMGAWGGPVGIGIGAVLGGLGGLFGSRGKKAALRRQAEMRAKLSRLDTEYAPLTGGRSAINPEEYGQYNSGAMGALGGAASGAMQGYNIYRGFQQDKENKEKMELLKQLAGSGQGLQMQDAGQSIAPILDSGNVYSNIGSMFA